MIAFATSGGTDPPFLATWPMDYKGSRMLVKCFESWYVGDQQYETMGCIGMLGLCSLGSP